MVVNENMRKLINNGASIDELRICAVNNGMIPLLESSVNLALNGLTTIEEVLKAGYTLG